MISRIKTSVEELLARICVSDGDERFISSGHDAHDQIVNGVIAIVQTALNDIHVSNFSELWETELRAGETYRRQLESSPFEHDQAHTVWIWYDDLVDLKQRAEKAEARIRQLELPIEGK